MLPVAPPVTLAVKSLFCLALNGSGDGFTERERLMESRWIPMGMDKLPVGLVPLLCICTGQTDEFGEQRQPEGICAVISVSRVGKYDVTNVGTIGSPINTFKNIHSSGG